MLNLTKYKDFLYQKKFELTTARKNKDDIEKQLAIDSVLLMDLEEARKIISDVGIMAQQEFKGLIENLLTQALQAIFGEGHSFEIENQVQRNKPETNFYVNINGRKHMLKGELGGGLLDVVSLGLRVVLWTLSCPRTDNVLVLDEPLKFLDGTRLEQACMMIRKLSDVLGIQFIIVTHEEDLMELSDRAYYVVKANGISTAKQIV